MHISCNSLRQILKQWIKFPVHAMDRVFYGCTCITQEKTHIRDSIDLQRFFSAILIALLPIAVASIYFFGKKALIIILVAYIANAISEILLCLVRKELIGDVFFIAGIIYPLTLPITLSLWMVALGIVVGVILSKAIYLRCDRKISATVLGWCFLYIGFPSYMTLCAYDPLRHEGKTTAVGIESDKIFAIQPTSNLSHSTNRQDYCPQLEGQSECHGNVRDIKSSLLSLFWGNRSGSLGSTSALLIISGGLFLMIARIANWRTIVSSLLAIAIFAYLFSQRQTAQERLYGVAFALLSGDILFGCMFIATEPDIGVLVNKARYIYGFAIGAIAILLSRHFTYWQAIMFSILMINILAILIDKIVIVLYYQTHCSDVS